MDTDGTACCAAVEGRATECVKLLVRRRGGHIGIDACAYINIAKGQDSLISCKFDVGAVVLPGWRFLLDQGAALKFDEWGVTSDTPVVAATLALQQAETIFYMDLDAVDGLKGVWRRFTLCRGVCLHVTDRRTENKRKKSGSIGRRGPSGRTCSWGHWLCTLASDGAFLGYEKKVVGLE